MRFFFGREPSEQQIDHQQARLRRMTAEVMTRYQRELTAEISDPDRLSAVYGAAFADANTRRQAETIAKMAVGMLKVANAAVNVITAAGMESIALILEGQVQVEQLNASLDDSYCKHVIHTGREMAIDDSTKHPLVCDSRLSIDGVAISYLGVPVANRNHIIVGTLCVFEEHQRTWGPADVSMLMQLSMVLTRSLPE